MSLHRSKGRSVSTMRASVILIALVVSACSAAAAPSESPTGSPEASPIASPSLAPAPSPSALPSPAGSNAIDAAAGLSIAAPYALTTAQADIATPDVMAGLATSLALADAGLGVAVGEEGEIGGRGIVRDGVAVGDVFVIAFPTGTITDAAYESFLPELAIGLGVHWKATSVSGVSVATGASGPIGYAVFRDGDRIFIVAALKSIAQTTIAAALIEALR